MPAILYTKGTPRPARPSSGLGPSGPFPDIPLARMLERRWLHYAFVSRDLALSMVANVALLGPSPDDPLRASRCTSILLLHQRERGWSASQFNARTLTPSWSAFSRPCAYGAPFPLEIASTANAPAVKLTVRRSSRPCTSQCAPFATDQHLRWQSESGVAACGDWDFGTHVRRGVDAVGYHERVRGYWGWPELGEWVFGFANDTHGGTGKPPPWAAVFTFIRPRAPAGATTASVMLWRDGRLCRHFGRRHVSIAVRGTLDRNRVQQVPSLANLLGVPPMAPIPQRLVISARRDNDYAVLDFEAEAAARIVIPCETSLAPFSVHEVIGSCRLEGRAGARSFAFETKGIVEFAGGAGGD